MQFLFLERKILQYTMLSQQQSQSQQQQTPSKKTDDQPLVHHAESIPIFPWGQRWLKGHEYGLMLQKMYQYCQRFGLAKYKLNDHPLEIYENPKNGMVYFMEGKSLKQFGFPRIQQRKVYRWKKMNFTTNLPKHNPIVTYLVASSVKKNSLSSSPNDEFRMHIVIPYKEQGGHILCHIKRVSSEKCDGDALPKKDVGLSECFSSASIDFYRLFAYIHNNHWIQK